MAMAQKSKGGKTSGLRLSLFSPRHTRASHDNRGNNLDISPTSIDKPERMEKSHNDRGGVGLDDRLDRLETMIQDITPSFKKEIHDLRESQNKQFGRITDNVKAIEQDLQSVKHENSHLKEQND